MKRCGYCGTKISADQKFCCEECKNNYKRQVQSDSRKIKYFILGMMIGFAVMLYGILSGNDAAVGTGIGFMGITVIIFPLTAPDTTDLFGYQRARAAGRILGILLAAVGVALIIGSLDAGRPAENARFDAGVIKERGLSADQAVKR